MKNILDCVCVFSHLQSEQLVRVYSIFLNGDGALGEGEAWQPEYRHPIQSVWRPHLALKPEQRLVGGEDEQGGSCRLMGVEMALI